MNEFPSWKKLCLEDLKLKKNWIKGKYIVRQLIGHQNKCVSRLKSIIITYNNIVFLVQSALCLHEWQPCGQWKCGCHNSVLAIINNYSA